MSGIKIFILLTVLIVAVKCQCVNEATFNSETILSEPDHNIEGCFQASFFQITIIPDRVEESNYEVFRVTEKDGLALLFLEGEAPSAAKKLINLATHSNSFSMSASGLSLPFSVHCKLIPYVSFQEDIAAISETVQGTITNFTDANQQHNYNFIVNKQGDQMFEITYNPLSVTSGFVALQNSNNRITLVTSPSRIARKFVIPSKDSVNIKIVTQNSANDSARIDYAIKYSIGQEEPVTSTPKPGTTPTPPPMASAQVYILEINVQNFVNESLLGILSSITNKLTQGDNKLCKVGFTPTYDCRHTCAMSDDPDRGCATFSVTVTPSYLCPLANSEKLTLALESQIPVWENDFKLNRVELNDCLVSTRVSWIGVAVGVPLVALAIIVAGLSILKVVKDTNKAKKKRIRKERPSESRGGRTSKGGLNGRQNQLFEIVE